jgi:anaerobic selenocysteine-containing dehydrogenase
MGGNFVAAAPDTQATVAALAKCGLTVQVSTKLNRSHVLGGRAALILPCLGRTELDLTGGHRQFVTVEDSMGIVHASRGGLEPAHPELRSEPGIVAAIGTRIAPEVPWAELVGDYDRIRDAIEAVVPGFADFNDRVRQRDGFALPHPPRDTRTFETVTGKARLTRNTFVGVEVPAGHLLLQTIRSHDQYNTTIYGLDDRYRGISQGRRVVLVHPADLADLGLDDAQVVDVVGIHDGVERRAERFRLVAYEVARGTCAAYFPEANVLVPLDSVAVESNTPTSKSIVVRFDAR